MAANLLVTTYWCLSVYRKGQNEKSGTNLFVARYNSSWQRVNQPFYTISNVNRPIRGCLFLDLGQNLCHFWPYFQYNSTVFYGIILQDKLHSFSIQDDRNTRLPSTTNYKNNSIIKRFCIENSPLDWTVQSGQSAIM